MFPKGSRGSSARRRSAAARSSSAARRSTRRCSTCSWQAAEAEGIEYGINVSAGATSTDMDAAQVSRAGIATGLVSIPTPYIHTPTELVSLADVEAATRLVSAFAQRPEPGLDFTR